MRYREDFTVFPRKLPSGKVIFYYYAYAKDGKRENARSTGQTTKSAAKAKCRELQKHNKLIMKKKNILKEYSKDWFIYDICPYINEKLNRGEEHSRTFSKDQRYHLERYILPTFGNMLIDDITPKMIENWRDTLKNNLQQKNSSINHYYRTFQLILNEAERLGDIDISPFHKARPLNEKPKKREILSDKEIKALFNPQKIQEIWSEYLYYAINFIAYTKGIRLGECLALKVENIHYDRIGIYHSWHKVEGLKTTKTKNSHDIPIGEILYSILMKVKELYHIDSGYIFSFTCGEKPINATTVRKHLIKALEKIDIPHAEQKRRSIDFHSWRHCCNTGLQELGLSNEFVRAVTGHKSESMTDHYSHIDSMKAKKIIELEEVY